MSREAFAFISGAIVGAGLAVGGFIVTWLAKYLGVESVPEKPEDDPTEEVQ